MKIREVLALWLSLSILVAMMFRNGDGVKGQPYKANAYWIADQKGTACVAVPATIYQVTSRLLIKAPV